MATFLRNLQAHAKRAAALRLSSNRTFCKASEVPTVVGVRLSPDKYPAAVLNALSLENASRSELRRSRKQGIIERYRRSPSDTGSPEVQIAVLTDRIKDLTGHVVNHRKDQHNKRRLVNLVNKRRSLMQYLLRKDPRRYITLVTDLGLRPSSVFSKDVPLGAKKAPTPTLHR